MTVKHKCDSQRQTLRQVKISRDMHDYEHHARNAKLAALVTEETAALLEQMAMLLGTTGWRGYAKEEIKDACALAARIREALALEATE